MKTKKKATRAPSLKFTVIKYHCFVGDTVTLTVVGDQLPHGNRTYEWSNGTAGTTVMQGETKRSITIQVTDANKDDMYNCKVTIGAQQIDADEMASIEASARPSGIDVPFNMHSITDDYATIHLPCTATDQMLVVLQQADLTPTGKNFMGQLVSMIEFLISEKSYTQAKYLYTALCGILEHENLVVIESRHGYKLIFHPGSTKDEFRHNMHGTVSAKGYPDMVDWWS